MEVWNDVTVTQWLVQKVERLSRTTLEYIMKEKMTAQTDGRLSIAEK